MLEIKPIELKEILQKEPQRFRLIDVRSPEEHELFNIGGTCIPLEDIATGIIPYINDKPLVLYCSKGIRSAIAIQRLEQKFPHQQLVNLYGGVEEWKKIFR